MKKSNLRLNTYMINNYNGTELKGSDGEITIHMVLLDNSIESAKARYGTVVIKVGYDYTANIDPTIVYAYDVRDRRNLVYSNTKTKTVQVKTPSGVDYDIYFDIIKYANKYRLVPKVNLKKNLVGNEDKTVLVIRSTISINH
ncbi:MAG: hypothetical protein ACQPRJ_04395 [Solitalea-like symbiont of Acarus siro]